MRNRVATRPRKSTSPGASEGVRRVVSDDLAGPLDRAVRSLFSVSWGKARDWVAAGKIRVGAEPQTDPTARVQSGDEVTLDERARRPRLRELPDDAVVYVDPHVIVVSKPPSLDTVPYEASDARRGSTGPEGVADSLDARVRDWLHRRSNATRRVRPSLGVVHRLDRDTTGLVVFTRTWLAKQSLSSQFRHHTVLRRYLAIASGDVPTRTLRSAFVENRGDGLRGSARGTPPAGAREAVTHVERLESLAGATLIACRLETGRTHQIRIHLSECGHPLVGEPVYVRGWRGPLIEAPRLMLHAAELGFEHPATHQAMRWEQAMPADMQAVLERLRQR